MALVVKNLLANAGDIRDTGLVPGSERSPGRRHSNPLQCSCLENPMDRGAWQATVHRVAKSQTQLKRFRMHVYLKGGIINHFYFLVFFSLFICIFARKYVLLSIFFN